MHNDKYKKRAERVSALRKTEKHILLYVVSERFGKPKLTN